MELNTEKGSSNDSYYLKQFRNKPFSVDDDETHYNHPHEQGNCCHWDIVRRPLKNNQRRTMYPYQHKLTDALEKDKLVAVFKCHASGITELALRYMGYLCLKNDKLQGTNMIIIQRLQKVC
jgi:hypothetical protein